MSANDIPDLYPPDMIAEQIDDDDDDLIGYSAHMEDLNAAHRLASAPDASIEDLRAAYGIAMNIATGLLEGIVG